MQQAIDALVSVSGHSWWTLVWSWMVVIATIPEAYGEYAQGKTIWDAKEANKLPLDAYAIDVATFGTTLCYGLVIGSWVYVFNGVFTGLAFVYVFWGIRRYGEHSRAQLTAAYTAACCLALVGVLTALFMIERSAALAWLVTAGMSGFLLLTVVSEARKLIALSRGEGTGQVNIRANNTWLATNAIFVLYAAGIRDPIFFACCFLCGGIQAAMLRTYCKKRHTTVRKLIEAYVRRLSRRTSS